MRRTFIFLLDAAAALFVALLLVVVPAHAQTITNVARADWTEGGVPRSILSNIVETPVTSAPVTLDTFRPVPGPGTGMPIQASICGGSPMVIFPGSGGGSTPIASEATDQLRVGEILILRFNAPAANLDSGAVDRVTAVLTTPRGDHEVLEIFETGNDTGVFTGAIRTRAIPPPLMQGDCVLSVISGDPITVAVGPDANTPPVLTTLVAVLADPFGFVFDSEDGSMVSGARVSLVDAATEAPAIVFADDGITPWPSTVLSGQPIIDGAGNVNPMDPGEYRFPLAALGNYRVVVEPPSPYSAPSVVAPAQLAGLRRPDGSPFIILDASYGSAFALNSPVPVRIDIPVDRPNVSVSLSKDASRLRAAPGDAIFYTLTVRNPDTRSKRDVTVIDTPSTWLRIRTDSVRIDGQPAGTAAQFSNDGRSVTFTLPVLAPGATLRLTYAMVVRPDAPPGQAVNRAEAIDPRGGSSVDEVSVRIENDVLTSRMTIIGRVTAGPCTLGEGRLGIPGVRIMLEDGSFAVTDAEGRYHFEGVVPGTHVVQAQRQTLPQGGNFVDCDRSTRTAGSAISKFVIGQGGSLAIADFSADVPGWVPPTSAPVQSTATADAAGADGASRTKPSVNAVQSDQEAAGADTDWLALGDGPTDFLFPGVDHNPRAPALRVVIRHEPGQKVELSANGKPVDPLALDGTRTSGAGTHAISIWRGIPLVDENTRLTAIVRNADGSVAAELARDIAFVSAPWKAEILSDRSKLVADGASRPVVAVRLTDRRGRPVRAGVSGAVSISEPYESAALLDQMQMQQLTRQATASANWLIEGDDGVAMIELAPTMVSGPLRLDFTFTDRELSRRQQLDSWVVPGDLDWTLVGLAEGSVGERNVAENMERSGRFDSDLGDNARVAFYAKGRVLGRFLLTMAYDSAKQEDDQRLLGAIDPKAYYTVFADGSQRRFDAASREKLYVRIESSTFYALYGDFVTGFDQTVLARYQRTATGAKAEGLWGGLHAQAFAAKIASSHRRDEIQGNGLTGPYRLGDRNIITNSEHVAIEVRDRFRPEIVLERNELTRFIDYNIDLLSGTISFKEPVLSRDFDLNPQFIVIDYEVEDGLGDSSWNAGARADYSFADGAVRIGASVISDKGDGSRTDLGAVDLRARIGDATELRAEIGVSRRDREEALGWLVEAEHRTGALDVLAYIQSIDEDYGTGQQTGATIGRRKIGVDARYAIDEHLSITGSAWHDDSLTDASQRRAIQLAATYRTAGTEARVGIAHFADRLATGEKADSTVLEGGVTQRLFDNKLELSASTSVSLGKAESIDLPARHRLRARYAVTNWLRLVGSYEIADGETLDARTFNGGFELSPWGGARVLTTLGQQSISEFGKRSFAAFGLSQSFPVTSNLTIDATVDGNRTLSGADPSQLLNPQHPAASGGFLTQDGAQFEDFTALTLGGAWRKDNWSAVMRGEYRDGELANRKGVTAGLIRQLGNGVVVGSGLSWTQAEGSNGAESEILDAAASIAYRPADSEFAFLGKLEFRSDRVVNAIAGETGPAGRTALSVTGDAKSERILASLSTNWSPVGMDDGELTRRTEVGLFLGARHNLDRYGNFDLATTTLLGGVDARIGIGDRIEIGGTATVRTEIDGGSTVFSFGPQIGFTPAKNTLLTVGYNVTGFRDPDFSAARNTDKGFYASVRMKFDADSFAFLGLGRR